MALTRTSKGQHVELLKRVGISNEENAKLKLLVGKPDAPTNPIYTLFPFME